MTTRWSAADNKTGELELIRAEFARIGYTDRECLLSCSAFCLGGTEFINIFCLGGTEFIRVDYTLAEDVSCRRLLSTIISIESGSCHKIALGLWPKPVI